MGKRMWKIGLVILVAGIMVLGYGGWCKKDDDSGSSGGSNLPAKVTLMAPADGATGVPVGTAVSWNVASGAASYDLYYSITNPPGMG